MLYESRAWIQRRCLPPLPLLQPPPPSWGARVAWIARCARPNTTPPPTKGLRGQGATVLIRWIPPSPALPPPPLGLKAGRAGGPDHSSCIRLPTAPPRILHKPEQISLEGGTEPTKRPPHVACWCHRPLQAVHHHWLSSMLFDQK